MNPQNVNLYLCTTCIFARQFSKKKLHVEAADKCLSATSCARIIRLAVPSRGDQPGS